MSKTFNKFVINIKVLTKNQIYIARKIKNNMRL